MVPVLFGATGHRKFLLEIISILLEYKSTELVNFYEVWKVVSYFLLHTNEFLSKTTHMSHILSGSNALCQMRGSPPPAPMQKINK